MPALSKYNAEYHDDWAWSLAIKGATNDEIADAFGISVRTLIRWIKKYDTLKESIDRGKMTADAKVEKSLYQRAIGYEVTDEENLIEMDKDGNMKPIKIKKTKKNIPPDTMACMYWLNNRKREDWNNKSKTDASNVVDDWVNSIPDVVEGNDESK